MTTLLARRALLPEGWARDVAVDLAPDGTIAAVRRDVAQAAGAARILLPALSNLHSHSFQRAMAGMTEARAEGGAAGRDSFWSWRALMYRFLDRLTPDQIEAIAAFAFVEMLEAGYAAVAEFHYVHHQPGGAPYADLAETSARVMAAARETGIGLTHLPVLYAFGGAGEQPLAGGQARFGADLELFARLVEAARQAARALPADTVVGVAPHSLRATNPAQLAEIARIYVGAPIHIHIAEQPAEVAQAQAWLGARPVAWLLGALPVGPRWCLIHATHMTEAETRALARSGAVAGLCPITEANLGDGAFNGPAYLAAGGALGVGSDSNVRISVSEELRTLEYGQRLRDGARNVLSVSEGSVGEGLYRRALAGGAQALGRDAGAIRAGALADLVALDADAPAFAALSDAQLLDGWVFAADDRVVREVWSAGRACVVEGRHIARDAVAARYRAALRALVDA